MIDKSKYYIFDLFNGLDEEYASNLEDVNIDIFNADQRISNYILEYKDQESDFPMEFDESLLFASKDNVIKLLKLYYQGTIDYLSSYIDSTSKEDVSEISHLDYRILYLISKYFYSINDLENGLQAMYLSVYLYCASNNPAYCDKNSIYRKYADDLIKYNEYIKTKYKNDCFDMIPRIESFLDGYGLPF